MADTERLREALDLGVVKKDENRTSAMAISASGDVYTGAQIDSDTNLLAFSAEHIALLLAVQQQDYEIEEIVAMQPSPENGVLLSPLTQKIMVDFCRRTGQTIGYTLLDSSGGKIWSTPSVQTLDPLYQPDNVILSKTVNAERSVNWVETKGPLSEMELKLLALSGIERCFTTYDSASGYGAAVSVGEKVFFSGQYSSFEGRLNIHAEMAAVISALMHGYTDITEIDVVSTKHEHEPCYMCAICTQFMIELSDRFDLDVSIYSHASQTVDKDVNRLDDLAPKIWRPRS